LFDRKHGVVADARLRYCRDLDGEVDFLGAHVHQRVGDGDLDIDGGMKRMKSAEQADQPFHRNGRKQPAADHAVLWVPASGLGGEFDPVERFADRMRILHAFRRQADIALAADEQAQAQKRLELGDVPADRALRDVQALRRFGEVPHPGGDFECAKRVKRWQLPCHQRLRHGSEGRHEKLTALPSA
jgi:hypothetical protein